MIREVHVYGKVAQLHGEGQNAQHRGLGKALVERACEIALDAGYRSINVISAIGTRGYYARLGFESAGLYQKRSRHFERPHAGATRANFLQNRVHHFATREGFSRIPIKYRKRAAPSGTAHMIFRRLTSPRRSSSRRPRRAVDTYRPAHSCTSQRHCAQSDPSCRRCGHPGS